MAGPATSELTRLLRLVTYLAPSLPLAFFEHVAAHLERQCGIPTALETITTISGPLPGDDEPFGEGRADIGFVCAPTFRWLRDRVRLLPIPVPLDPRSEDRPVYFSDVIVRDDAPARSLEDLRGRVWAFNDRNSRSGWFSMVERIGNPEAYFSRLVDAGAHLRAIDAVRSGEADVAAIDSNVLRLQRPEGIRVIESWGPFPIQPVIARRGLPCERDVAAALLTLDGLEPFGFRRFAEADPSLYA